MLYIRNPTSAPVLLLGHLLGGPVTLAALHFARARRRVDAIEIACVIDADDLGDPASQADFERQAKLGPSLILDRGRWTSVIGPEATRRRPSGAPRWARRCRDRDASDLGDEYFARITAPRGSISRAR